jgi:diguanylate cyclase (GGDEF)-like protein
LSYSRTLAPPVVAAAVATIAVTSFTTILLIQDHRLTRIELMGAVWPIVLTSSVAVVLVMSLLYRALLDLIQRLEEREADARHAAVHDQLTGLPNRMLLQDRLESALARRRRHNEKVALVLLDVDRFKQVNDLMGHLAGDQLIQQVGQRLLHLGRETDTVARLGGDEFAIILANPGGLPEIKGFCGRVLSAFKEPFVLDGRTAPVGISMGAVLASERSADATDLLRKADMTMYKAKAAGRGCFRVYSDEMDVALQRRDHIEVELKKALVDGTLDLHYQPQLSAAGRVTGFECLLRWSHPHLGQLTPGEVIPIAEECGLIHDVGDFVFRRACKAAGGWPDLTFAVNLSPQQFRLAGLPSRLERIAAEEGVEHRQVELEITENLLIEHGDLCAEAIQELRAMGFPVALDDFGTGYSSLAYLRHFQVDRIKLDRSFLDGEQVEVSIALIRAAVNLGHAMGLEVVAEGVSDKVQEQAAIQAGCDFLQGFLYSPAVPWEEVEPFLRRLRSALAA